MNTDQPLRDVNVDGYRLTTWDTGRTGEYDKACLRYRLMHPDGRMLFDAEDFFCSPCYAIDSDEALRGILFFLTLQPGETESGFFDDYTHEQLEWAGAEAEDLVIWSIDGTEDGEENGPHCEFVDWEEGSEER